MRPYWPIILGIAAVKFAVQFYASASYNYFRDELYYIACAHHLDWGYVDHSPLIGVYAKIGETLGPSLRGFRLLATISGVARIILTGVLTARLGGNKTAQALACTTVLLVPCYLAVDSILTMNGFEHLFWLGCILVAVSIANGASEKWWLLFGVFAGLGLQNKHSMLFFGAAITAAMLLTPMRRAFARPWIWLGGAIAFLIFLPNLIWQYQHGFPTVELLRNVKETGKNIVLPPGEFIVQQIMMLNPFTAILWITGLVALFLWSRYRFLGWAYIIILGIFIALEAKDYYLAPIYPMLFAAGAVAVSKKRWATIGVFAIVIIGCAISVPLVLPILTPENYVAYQRAIGAEQKPAEVSHTSEMPQIFSDQLGWEEMVRDVARVYHALPEDERKRTAIYGSNYGQTAAIDFYGPKYGLPKAISGHQSYYLWGPRDYTGESMLVIASGIVRTRPLYRSINIAGQRKGHPFGIPEERGPIFHCRTKRPLREIWESYKFYR